jgi:hypothetical protein
MTEAARTVIMEIVKKVKIEDGDILIVRTMDNDTLRMAADEFAALYSDDRKFMLVEESGLDILREADEEMMREFGWQRIEEK